MSGWTLDIFNGNLLPLTHDQVRLRKEFQAWLAKLFLLGQTEITFLTVCDRFPRANYGDLMCVYDDFHREGFLEEVHARYSLGRADTCDLSDDDGEEGYEM